MFYYLVKASRGASTTINIGQNRLMEQLERTKKMVYLYTKELVDARLISVRRLGCNSVNEYTFLWHACLPFRGWPATTAAAPAAPAKPPSARQSSTRPAAPPPAPATSDASPSFNGQTITIPISYLEALLETLRVLSAKVGAEINLPPLPDSKKIVQPLESKDNQSERRESGREDWRYNLEHSKDGHKRAAARLNQAKFFGSQFESNFDAAARRFKKLQLESEEAMTVAEQIVESQIPYHIGLIDEFARAAHMGVFRKPATTPTEVNHEETPPPPLPVESDVPIRSGIHLPGVEMCYECKRTGVVEHPPDPIQVCKCAFGKELRRGGWNQEWTGVTANYYATAFRNSGVNVPDRKPPERETVSAFNGDQKHAGPSAAASAGKGCS